MVQAHLPRIGDERTAMERVVLSPEGLLRFYTQFAVQQPLEVW